MVAVQIILDSSYSMKSTTSDDFTRFEVAKTSLLKQISDELCSNTILGLKSFDIKAAIPRTILPLGKYSRDEVIAAINTICLTPCGTPLAQTIEVCADELAVIEAKKKVVLCFSDGDHTIFPPHMRDAFEKIEHLKLDLNIDLELTLANIGELSDETAREYKTALESGNGTFIDIADGASHQKIEKNIELAFDVSLSNGEAKSISKNLVDELNQRSQLIRFEKKIQKLSDRIALQDKQLKKINNKGVDWFVIASAALSMYLLVNFSQVKDKVTLMESKIVSFATSLDNAWEVLNGGQKDG